MTLKRIHINQHKIKANIKNGSSLPVISVKHGRKNTYGHSVKILGPSEVVYSPDRPLECGARVWIATLADVLVDGVKVDSKGQSECALQDD